MKKFITTLILAFLSVLCVFAFTACGNGKETEKGTETEKEAKTTVTAEEWKVALTYFKVNSEEGGVPATSNYPRIDFSCSVKSYINGDGDGTNDYTITLDFTNNAYEDKEYKHGGDYYGWKDGDTCYMIADGGYVDAETGEFIECYSKKVTSEEELLEGLDAYIFVSAGGIYICELGLADKFPEFTYSEDKKEYATRIDYEEGSCDISIKFVDGKLSLLEITNISEEEGSITTVYEYTYGTTVTVPEYFLNLKLGETPKPQKTNK